MANRLSKEKEGYNVHAGLRDNEPLTANQINQRARDNETVTKAQATLFKPLINRTIELLTCQQ